ncbi:Putative peroxiredoxin bcp [Zhongshania aliphaticivorans]|uniref:Peroxiredoxin bcp n=1 Tax=Zhongshania aliphaticivorans TaxID=1470434 RepID=A0A5S9PIX9_9GAMM|nr:redoxin domain-containing protein [Zhongshania aliphaticivorans]CAA0104009.1 Putative peroxiredoxin bcp [Zhongshania aliphaticivorans]CAA0104166.1 Putative peroxiredoxin bcp [Zhongshania aliphaticivorans]
MNSFKSHFISAWMTLLFAGTARSAWAIYQQENTSSWLWVLLGVASPLLFFVWVFTANVARTEKATKFILAVTILALIGLVATPPATIEQLAWILLVGVIGTVLYEWWYSSFGDRSNALLDVGQTLPALTFRKTDGGALNTNELNKPMLMIFYRGNWCPLCMAQIKEIAGQYRQLADKGVEVMLISSQPPSHTSSLAERFDAPMSFLVDQDNQMANRLGIAATQGLPSGLQALGYDSDTVMPTVIMTDAQSKILFADLTDNYRIRPEPDTFLKVFAQAGI